MENLLFDGHDYKIIERPNIWEVYNSEGTFLFEVLHEGEYFIPSGSVEAECAPPIHENATDVYSVIKSVISSTY